MIEKLNLKEAKRIIRIAIEENMCMAYRLYIHGQNHLNGFIA